MTQQFNRGISYLRQTHSCHWNPGNAGVHRAHIHETALGTTKHSHTSEHTARGTRVHRTLLGSKHWGQVPQLCPEARDSPRGPPHVKFFTKPNNGSRRPGSECVGGEGPAPPVHPAQMPSGRADTQKPYRATNNCLQQTAES